MLPRTADILVVSPQAGNCFDAAEMIPPVRSSVRLVIMSINPLYAPPTRVMPNFEETLPQRKGLADLKPTDRHKLQRLLFLTQCSLQSAVDLMAPRFVLLFVDGARAIFAEKSIAPSLHLSLFDYADGCINSDANRVWRVFASLDV